MLKKMFFTVGLAIALVATAQVQTETFYLDGVKTETRTYMEEGYEIVDTRIDGRLDSRSKTSGGVTVSASLEDHKSYGRYVAVNLIIYNGTDQAFDFIPADHVDATLFDGKKTNQSLQYLEYEKIVKRRQNGAAFGMAMLGGLAMMNAGSTSHSGYAGGTYYSGRSYSSSLAYLQTRQTAQDLADYAGWQKGKFLEAKHSYLKSNTVVPGESIVGHILIPKKRLGPGAIATAIITAGNASFHFSKTF